MKAIIVVALAASSTAHADIVDGWHVNVTLTSDWDTQKARVGGGTRFGALKTSVVLDANPLGDGRDDVDAIVEYSGSSGWGALAGWRAASIEIEQGRQWQQQFLVGAIGGLPALGRIQPSFGAELVTAIVRHGEMLETDWISFASFRHVKDTISINLFVRFEYAR